MRFLSLPEALDLHERILATSGGGVGIRDFGALESAIAQPRVCFGGKDLYPDLVAKAAALCFSLVMNHPFVDGNKRIGHAAMETFLILNAGEIDASIDEQEQTILTLASGEMSRESFAAWVREHAVIN